MFESLGIVPGSHRQYPSVALQDFVSLRRLTVSGYSGTKSAINMLECDLGISPKLEELNVLYLHPGDMEAMDDLEVQEIFEGQLQLDDERFSSMNTSGKFPCLRRVNIMLAVPLLVDDGTPELCLRRCLPSIHETGNLVVKVGEHGDVDQFMKDASILSCG